MRVFYRCRKSKKSIIVYEQGPVDFCCASMWRWWDVMIGFGVRACTASTSRGVSLFYDRPQASGKSLIEIVEVHFCPFCGEAIETCQMK
jgi:hypothetical protein